MRAPHPVGARVIKLDTRLARASIAPHEWGEALRLRVSPAGAAGTDPRAFSADITLVHAAARPWAPAHLRARRDPDGDVVIGWVRRARIGGDHWGAGEPPLEPGGERYLLEILDGSTLKRSLSLTAPTYLYSAAEQSLDFGGPPSTIRVRVAALDSRGAPGLKTDLTLPLY